MDVQMIGGLFTLFSGEEDVESVLPLLMAAKAEVLCSVRRDADVTDVRLCYLTAAVANLQYRVMCRAQERTGTLLGTTMGAACGDGGFAERLVQCYRRLCADLLRDEAFCFLQTGGQHDGAA